MFEWQKKRAKKEPIGLILYDGKSLLDGKRIVVIATGVFGQSKNSKTGDVIQTYILRKDIEPLLAHRLGEDYSVCGDCLLKENGICYVNMAHGPIAVFKAYHDGGYRDIQPDDIQYFRDKILRIGSYGDPAAVPFEIWDTLCRVSKGFVGYSHQWEICDQRLKQYCMASIDGIRDSVKEYNKAQKMGWRTFRVRINEDEPLLDKEFVCPASKEQGKLITCEQCRACGGLSSKCTKNVTIILHGDSEEMGSMWRKERYMEARRLCKNKKKFRRNYKMERKKFKKICKV